MTTDSGYKTKKVKFTSALPHLYAKKAEIHCKQLKPHPHMPIFQLKDNIPKYFYGAFL